MFMNRGVPRLIAWRLLLALTLFSSHIYNSPESHRNGHSDIIVENRALLLLVIDFSDFNCPLCLDSLLNFCRMLPPSYSEVMIWGIVVNNKGLGNDQDSSAIQIMDKKIRGFIEANDISFPLILDRNCVFNQLSHQGSTVMVIDLKKQIVSHFDFPLEPQEIQHIQHILFLHQN